MKGQTLGWSKEPQIYLTPVKTQLLQYKLTRDLMLFYHSYEMKA